MGYLNDYMHYCSGMECSDEFHHWSALALLGAVAGQKVWTMHGGYFRIHPNIFVCLVGNAGSGKSVAKDIAGDIYVKNFPDFLVSASIQSREDIADRMADDSCIRTWKDELGQRGPIGTIYEYRPFFILANELQNFFSVERGKMAQFITDIYDAKRFSTGFKNQRYANPERKQHFENPYVSMIACATPEWFMSDLKSDLFSGGLGRRLIIVYGERVRILPNPMPPADGQVALARAVEHVKRVHAHQGQMFRTPEADKFWEEWYRKHKSQYYDDPILAQFSGTKPIQVLKVAMLLAKSEFPEATKIEAAHLEYAVTLFEQLEPRIVRLTSGIGRNELAGVGAQLIEHIEKLGGYVSEVQLKKAFYRYLKNPEFLEVLNHFQEIGKLVYFEMDRGDGTKLRCFATPEGKKQLEAQIKARSSASPASTAPSPASAPVQGASPAASA